RRLLRSIGGRSQSRVPLGPVACASTRRSHVRPNGGQRCPTGIRCGAARQVAASAVATAVYGPVASPGEWLLNWNGPPDVPPAAPKGGDTWSSEPSSRASSTSANDCQDGAR